MYVGGYMWVDIYMWVVVGDFGEMRCVVKCVHL